MCFFAARANDYSLSYNCWRACVNISGHNFMQPPSHCHHGSSAVLTCVQQHGSNGSCRHTFTCRQHTPWRFSNSSDSNLGTTIQQGTCLSWQLKAAQAVSAFRRCCKTRWIENINHREEVTIVTSTDLPLCHSALCSVPRT